MFIINSKNKINNSVKRWQIKQFKTVGESQLK